MITPIIIAKAKGLITSPPKVYRHIKAIKVVKLVIIVRDKVLFIDGRYVYSENRRRSRCIWVVKYYWPVRIKVKTFCLNNTQFMMNILVFKIYT